MVHSEGNLNQIGSLWREEDDNNWQWACLDMSPTRTSRHDNVVRVVT